MPNTLKPSHVATLATELNGSGAQVQLLPDGEFTAVDGRPASLQGVTAKSWVMNGEIAQALIAARSTRKTRVAIDYEHQTQRAVQNGQPAPAAGFYSTLEWRPGIGLFATDVEWTPKAKAAIDAGEYKYISPVFSFDPKTGALLSLFMAALTNTPGIDGMSPVTLTQFYQSTNDNEDTMNKLLAALLAALNLPAGTTEDQAAAALTLHMTAHAALKSDHASQSGQIATLSAQITKPDPTKFAPMELLQSMQAQLSQLTAQNASNQVAALVSSGLATGKLSAATAPWATELGNKDLALLKSFLEANPGNPALAGTQTGGSPPNGGGMTITLTAEDIEVARQFGKDPTKMRPLPEEVRK
jgi:phage I-like protein